MENKDLLKYYYLGRVSDVDSARHGETFNDACTLAEQVRQLKSQLSEANTQLEHFTKRYVCMGGDLVDVQRKLSESNKRLEAAKRVVTRYAVARDPRDVEVILAEIEKLIDEELNK